MVCNRLDHQAVPSHDLVLMLVRAVNPCVGLDHQRSGDYTASNTTSDFIYNKSRLISLDFHTYNNKFPSKHATHPSPVQRAVPTYL